MRRPECGRDTTLTAGVGTSWGGEGRSGAPPLELGAGSLLRPPERRGGRPRNRRRIARASGSMPAPRAGSTPPTSAWSRRPPGTCGTRDDLRLDVTGSVAFPLSPRLSFRTQRADAVRLPSVPRANPPLRSPRRPPGGAGGGAPGAARPDPARGARAPLVGAADAMPGHAPRAVVLGPQPGDIRLGVALRALIPAPGPVAAITVGWRETEPVRKEVGRELERCGYQPVLLQLGERVVAGVRPRPGTRGAASGACRRHSSPRKSSTARVCGAPSGPRARWPGSRWGDATGRLTPRRRGGESWRRTGSTSRTRRLSGGSSALRSGRGERPALREEKEEVEGLLRGRRRGRPYRGACRGDPKPPPPVRTRVAAGPAPDSRLVRGSHGAHPADRALPRSASPRLRPARDPGRGPCGVPGGRVLSRRPGAVGSRRPGKRPAARRQGSRPSAPCCSTPATGSTGTGERWSAPGGVRVLGGEGEVESCGRSEAGMSGPADLAIHELVLGGPAPEAVDRFIEGHDFPIREGPHTTFVVPRQGPTRVLLGHWLFGTGAAREMERIPGSDCVVSHPGPAGGIARRIPVPAGLGRRCRVDSRPP